MSTAAVSEGIAEASPRLKARMAAALWVLYVAMSGLAGFARRGLIVSGEAATTATNILVHEPSFRLAFAADLLAIACYVAMTAVLYGLFKPVNRTVSLIASVFSLVGCTIQGSACVFEYAPLIVLKGAQPWSALKVEELQTLAYLLLKLYSQGYGIALVFFAFFNLLVGCLAFKSTFLPRILGVLMAVSGIAGLTFLAPSFAAKYFPYILATFIGEGLLFLWLLVAGVNAQRWKERARAAGLSLAILAAFAAVSAYAQAPQIEQARAALGRGDSDAAIAIMDKLVAQYPKSADAHFCLANAYMIKAQQGDMLSAATYGSKVKGELETAIALDPRNVDARYTLVQIYAQAPTFMGGSYDKALEQAKEIKTIDPVVGHRAFAVVYAQQKKFNLAKQEYLDALGEQPTSPKAHSYFGQYLVNIEKNYAAAFAEFEAALKHDPSYMAAFYHLGRTAAMADSNLGRGEESLKKYLAYTPKANEPTLANAYYNLGAVYEKEGKKAEAKRSYEAALKLNPTLKQASEALRRVS